MSDLIRREDALKVAEEMINWPDTFHQEMLRNVKSRIMDIPEAKLRFSEVYDDIVIIKDKLLELETWM